MHFSIITLTERTEDLSAIDSDQRISLGNQINELGLKIDAFAAERKAIVESVGLAPLEVGPSFKVRTSSFYLSAWSLAHITFPEERIHIILQTNSICVCNTSNWNVIGIV